MKYLFWLLLTALLATPAYVHAQGSSEDLGGGSGSFNTGLQLVDVEPLNDVLEPAGYEALDQANLQIGGGGQFYLRRVVISLKGAFVGQSEVESNTHSLDFGGGYFMFNGGYNLLQKKRLLLYPSVGFGFIGFALEQRPRRAGTGFSDYFSDPADNQNEATTLLSSAGLLEVGLHADWFLQGDEKAGYGPMLGLGAGYRFASEATFENLAGTEVDSSPDFRPGGFFVTLRIGGGGYGEQRDE